MKTCSKCGYAMSDAEMTCPHCHSDYLTGILDDVLGPQQSVPSENDLVLDILEQSLANIDNAPVPTAGETFRRIWPLCKAVVAVLLFSAGFATAVPFFHLLGFVALGFVGFDWLKNRRKRALSSGEALIVAAEHVFHEETAPLAARKDAKTDQRLRQMQEHIDRAYERMAEGHRANRFRVWIPVGVVLFLFCFGIGTLAVHRYKVRKAESEYAALPEWVKLRTDYRNAEDTEFAESARIAVVDAMLAAGVATEAEGFFFASCQGLVGDYACAKSIAEHYVRIGDRTALNAFIEKAELRYESDNRKLESLKK